MGLDMYLNAKRYVGYGNDALKTKLTEAAESPFGEVNEVKVEAAYWRKANEIHHWFVTNIQDGVDECQESYVDKEQLAKLRDICKTVMDDHSMAPILLPTTGGFFFGSTDYNEYYFSSIEDTYIQLNSILEKDSTGWDFYYQASW